MFLSMMQRRKPLNMGISGFFSPSWNKYSTLKINSEVLNESLEL
jgi:hypothetical protein